jgi:hypothetical protein
MYQATRKGGGILVTVPHHPFLWSALDVHAHHVRRYRAAELRKKIETAGFSIMRMTSFVSLLLPLMMVSRLRMRDPSKELSNSEIETNKFLNEVLERILGLERILIQRGLSFPAGGSLLAIARHD